MYKLLAIIAITLLSQSTQASKVKDAIEKPNIIIFYVDDLGWQDTQLNDIDAPTPWETPNMLALAKRGMNFSQAYSPALTCAPSRAGLLSGQHPAKINFTHVSGAGIPAAMNQHARAISPYYNDHLSADTLTLAQALKANGYKTGHVGKWHLGHYRSNSPATYGFDFTYGGRGAHRNSKNRAKIFDDSTYPLSKQKYPPYSKNNPQGIAYPLDLVTENALSFVTESKAEPFFLYLAHWMVHVPIITKNRALLTHYTDKLAIPFPQTAEPITTPGQTNPYYGAMVTTVDWSLGRLMSLLETTDDPRNPGKKLSETTYIFFSSDNGGTETKDTEIITDNYPLDKGKKHTEEGGVRVPMVVAGPTVNSGTESHEIVSQLDYFPTILALTESSIDKQFTDKLSGLDLSPVLRGNSERVADKDGEARKSLFWHFPHYGDDSMRGAIREGDYKLYKYYVGNRYSLYRLYKDGKRYDLEESKDLATDPAYASVVKTLAANLDRLLQENNAVYPHLNPKNTDNIAARTSVPAVLSSKFNKVKREAQISLVTGKTAVKDAYLLAEIAKPKSGNKRGKLIITYKKLPVMLNSEAMTITAHVPAGHDAYLFVLIDENNFLVTSERYTSL